MSISEEFVSMVFELRCRQKEYFEIATAEDAHRRAHELRRALQFAKAAEKKVDDWLEQHAKECVQLGMWNRSVKGSELPGAYNVAREEDLAKR